MTKGKGSSRFIAYVNRNIGKELTTLKISKGARLHLRRTQAFCKIARENSPYKVKYDNSSKTIVYSFKRPIRETDITI